MESQTLHEDLCLLQLLNIFDVSILIKLFGDLRTVFGAFAFGEDKPKLAEAREFLIQSFRLVLIPMLCLVFCAKVPDSRQGVTVGFEVSNSLAILLQDAPHGVVVFHGANYSRVKVLHMHLEVLGKLECIFAQLFVVFEKAQEPANI